MNPEDKYLEVNKESWNQRVDTHFDSEFYDVEGFLKGNTSLNSIELDLLGDITGKKVLHLQCHFGQDSISLSRMGGEVTGIDFSDKAIEKARELALQAGTDTKFICSDVYNLPNVLHEQFDIVFTSYGTIGWLPDLDEWASIINHFLKPGGQFVFAEFHPVVWMFDDDFKGIGYNYFKSDAIVETNTGTYAEKKAEMQLKSISWNHSLSEVFTSLMGNKMQIQAFNEFNYSPYNCFSHTEEFEPKKFRIKHLGNNIPMVYSLLAIKPE
ncbi:class I SAM-dependent methyltransferase [Elizabethkingia occulta]|uniref:Methyltransferase type 12 n=1 Tax=Elizabethkingia occulta TaxID=1867263 RepID=A0A1T3MYU6_9FLAO|nr:class I SAM-dependent methyltransferase [Elizabethkingia occulta]OPC69795.1 methyltransferase type 12 [Elizabethkingia occulta]